MKIKKIKKMKKDLYKVSIVKDDEEYDFKLSEDFLLANQIYQNKTLDDNEFDKLKALENQSTLYVKVLKFILYKMRTEQEVLSYLKDKGSIEPHTSTIINKLKRLNYINDKVFTERYIKNQFEMNKKGSYLIKKELQKKKVNNQYISEGLKSITEDMIEKNINQWICHYDKLNKNKTIKKLKENILKNLLRKGYDYENILPLLNNYSFYENNNDELLLEKEVTKALRKYRKKYQGYDLKERLMKSLLNKGFHYEDILNYMASINLEE